MTTRLRAFGETIALVRGALVRSLTEIYGQAGLDALLTARATS